MMTDSSSGDHRQPNVINKTDPKVDHPRALFLSANSTPQDIFKARIFEEPLLPIGADPTPTENAALAAALAAYSNRTGPDDFSGLTGFLAAYPESPWNAALLTGLRLEPLNTRH